MKATLKPMQISIIGHFATNFKSNWNRAKSDVQKVVDLYNVMGLPPLNSKQLHGLFNDTINTLYDIFTGNEAAHLTIGKGEGRGHLAIDRVKAMDILDKPKGYDELLAAIAESSKSLANAYTANTPYDVRVNAAQIIDTFVIDENGNLGFTETVATGIENAGKVFVNTEKGQAIYNFLQKVTEAYIECGLDTFRGNTSFREIDGDKVADIVRDGIRSIDLDAKSYSPVTVSNTIQPRLPFDNDIKNL